MSHIWTCVIMAKKSRPSDNVTEAKKIEDCSFRLIISEATNSTTTITTILDSMDTNTA